MPHNSVKKKGNAKRKIKVGMKCILVFVIVAIAYLLLLQMFQSSKIANGTFEYNQNDSLLDNNATIENKDYSENVEMIENVSETVGTDMSGKDIDVYFGLDSSEANRYIPSEDTNPEIENIYAYFYAKNLGQKTAICDFEIKIMDSATNQYLPNPDYQNFALNITSGQEIKHDIQILKKDATSFNFIINPSCRSED